MSSHETEYQYRTDIDDFAKALESVFNGKATILNRMRLACSFYDRELAKIGNEGDGSPPPIEDYNHLMLYRLAGHERNRLTPRR